MEMAADDLGRGYYCCNCKKRLNTRWVRLLWGTRAYVFVCLRIRCIRRRMSPEEPDSLFYIYPEL